MESLISQRLQINCATEAKFIREFEQVARLAGLFLQVKRFSRLLVGRSLPASLVESSKVV